jgi:predicted nucleotidyltransferase
MTNIFLNLSGKIEKPVVDTLQILKKVADSLRISFFIIGASARDFILKHQHGIEPRRKTGDIDLGVEVASWDHFKTGILSQLRKLRDGFVEVGEKP